ncbi:MAG: vWA domain-containing protein [Planctomycetota bacterium]
MHRVAAVSCLLLGSFALPPALAHEPNPPQIERPIIRCEVGVQPVIDVALLLDTSNSMDGLIHQAKSQLWTIVQRFAQAEKHGQPPRLRVALFQYGNTNLPAAEGYLQQVVPLTDNLDELSAALFKLTTNGGDEYCGQVIDEALTRLDWSDQPGAYLAIFIAGNEPFTQGSVDYRDACARAIQMGVVVNTIHCGDYQAGVNGDWSAGAQLAEGDYLNIDQDRAIVHIDCPQDAEILRLNEKLNKTYLWFGRADVREELGRNQIAQDAMALKLAPATAVARAASKATPVYSNRGRDLVDTFADAPADVATVAEAELPEVLLGLSGEERVAKITTLGTERADLQQRIAELSAERDAFLAEARKAQVEEGESTLGGAMLEAIDRQLAAAGFSGNEPSE